MLILPVDVAVEKALAVEAVVKKTLEKVTETDDETANK